MQSRGLSTQETHIMLSLSSLISNLFIFFILMTTTNNMTQLKRTEFMTLQSDQDKEDAAQNRTLKHNMYSV